MHNNFKDDEDVTFSVAQNTVKFQGNEYSYSIYYSNFPIPEGTTVLYFPGLTCTQLQGPVLFCLWFSTERGC